MARDLLENLNKRLTGLYDKLTGAVPGDYNLRPRDVVRRVVEAMEDRQREGLDGNIYVPNVYTLQVAVETEEERQYLRAFLSADELATALAEEISARGYSIKGMLVFTVEETKPQKTVNGAPVERIKTMCKFDPEAGVKDGATVSATAVPGSTPPAPALTPEARPVEAADDPGTLPAVAPMLAHATLAQLTPISGAGDNQRPFSLSVTGAKIGRSKNIGNTLVFEHDPLISKSHARIAFEGGGFVVYDENSLNGTLVNGKTASPGTPVALNDGDELRVGDVRLRFTEFGGDRTLPRKSAPVAAPAPTPPAVTGGNGAFCLVAGDGTIFPLASQMSLGRALTEDISLVGNGVAARHARLTVRDDSVYVEDTGTPGGTFVNGERIPAHFPVALYPEDQVAFGEVLLRVQRGYKRL